MPPYLPLPTFRMSIAHSDTAEDHLQYTKRERTFFSCTLARPDQEPIRIHEEKNAPIWAHLHYHAVRIEIFGRVSLEQLVSVDAKL